MYHITPIINSRRNEQGSEAHFLFYVDFNFMWTPVTSSVVTAW